MIANPEFADPPRRRDAFDLVCAILIPFAAFAVQYIAWSAIQPFVWFLFFPAVFFSSWIGGRIGGLAATAISSGLVWYFFLPPRFSFQLESPTILISIAVFIGMGVLFSLVHERLRRANRFVAAAALRIGEERYRLLFENMKEGAAYCRLIHEDGKPVDFVYLTVNPMFTELTGLKDVPGKRVSEVVPGFRENDAELFDVYVEVASTGKPEKLEKFVKALNMWFSLSIFSPEKDHFVAVFDIITERKAAEARISRLSQLYSALSQCNQAIVYSQSETELFSKICRVVVEKGGMKMAWIAMVNEKTGLVHSVTAHGEGKEYLEGIEISVDADDPKGCGPIGTAVRENTPVWCQDYQHDPTTAPWRERGAKYGWGGAASLPLHRNGKTIGALTIYSEASHAFDEEVRSLLEEMAHDISYALEGFSREESRKHSETMARQEQALNKAIIESIPGTFYMLDESGGFVRWNAFERDEIIGKPEELVAGCHAMDTVHQDDRCESAAKLQTLLQTGGTESAEIRLLMRGGPAFRWFLVIGRQMVLDNRRFVIGIGIDITERKQAEEELKSLRTAVEQSGDTIVITNGSGAVEYVNPAFEKSTGYSSAEVLGKNPRILKSGDQTEEFYKNLWETISAGRTWRGQFQNRRKDGSLYWEAASISPVLDHSQKIAHYIAIKEDITERKAMEARLLDALERAESASRAKGEFLAVMSHELRTPLNGVLGFADLLADTQLTDEQREFAKTIKASGDHLLDIVNDILDFSSIDKGRMKLELEKVSIDEIVENCCRATRKAAADKGLDFRYEEGVDVPQTITGDARRIRQLLFNLLGNAVKFTSHGSIWLRTAITSDGRCRFLEFSVTDTGPGISPETLALLFQPFSQGDSTLSRRFEGTGLGLAISQRLAEAMHGKVFVNSVPGQGSTFTFRFPLDREDAPISRKNADLAQPSDFKGGGRVLVVEDDIVNSTLAMKFLENLGFQARAVFNGQEAVEAFQTDKYSAILMDMQMPVMNGLDATKKIRVLEMGSGTRVQIVALTANVMPGDRERCLAAGMDDFLRKPFKRDELAAKLVGLFAPGSISVKQ